MGKTKIFLRTGQVALIERIRHQILTNSCILIQKIWRGFIKRRQYAFIKQSILNIQVIKEKYLKEKFFRLLQKPIWLINE